MAQVAIIKQMSRQVSRGSAVDYQADEQAGIARLRSGEVLLFHGDLCDPT